jgi:hypothetical protein
MNLPTETPECVLVSELELYSQTRYDEAWEHLNGPVQKFPADVRLRFLMGSMLAGRQRCKQTLRQLEFAVQMDLGFELAGFQLGSLRFTSGDAWGARHARGPLAGLSDAHPLKCFKNDCEALMEVRLEETIQWLQQGIAANTTNAHLSHDMQLLVDKTLEQMQINQTNVASEGSTHLLISGYQTNAPEPQKFDKSVDPNHHTKH